MKTVKRFIYLFLAVSLLCSLCACGASEKPAEISMDVNAVYEKLLASAEVPEMAQLSEKKIRNVIGIEPEDYVQAVVALCGDSVRCDEIWIIEASGSEAAARIYESAQFRLNAKISELENYLPDQYSVAKQGQIIQRGNYIAMFVSPSADVMKDIFNSAG